MPIIKGNDIIAQAQSSTVKIATFDIGTLQLIGPEQNEIQCLVLSPTRELANQTSLVYTFLGEYMNIKTCLIIGGTRLESNIKELKKGAKILFVSPGRVLDLLSKKIFSLNYLKCFVLDEADEMLSKGFLEEIKKIISLIPITAKILLLFRDYA